MKSQLTGGSGAATTEDSAAGAAGGRGLGTTLERPVNRMLVFAGILVIVLLGGLGLGRMTGDGPARGAVGGVGETPDHTHAPGEPSHDHPAPAGVSQDTGGNDAGHDHGSLGADASPDATEDVTVGGLLVSRSGYRLVPETAMLPVGRQHDFRFQVRGPDGRVVTTFEVRHEKPLHLIMVRRDLTGYQHLHPTMADDGTWHIPLTLPEAGSWRAYADFAARDAAGTVRELTLGMDLAVAGDFEPRPLPPAAREATVDEFTVTIEGTPQVGAVQPLLFRVRADGAAVPALQRYLGAYGHLVALREGDLGYVHVHPEEELSNGAIKFWLAAPSSGQFRLFLDFQVAGAVRTAEFTLTVP